MGALLEARRRHIASRGRAMTLVRPTTGGAPIQFTGFLHGFAPQARDGGVQQADQVVETLAPPFADLPGGRPITNDRIQAGARSWTVRDAAGVYEGEALIGWKIAVKGGG